MSEIIVKPEFDEKFEDDVRKAITLNEREGLKSFVAGLEANYHEQVHHETIVRPLYKKKWLMMAASFLLLAAAFFTFRTMSSSSPSQLAGQYMEAYPNGYRPITRGQSNDADAEWYALTIYEAGQFEKAIPLFQDLPDQNSDIRLFTAVSAIETDDLVLAKKELTQIISKKDRLLKPAQWYMSMVMLEEDNVDAAKKYLQTLADQPETASYRDKAMEILKELN